MIKSREITNEKFFKLYLFNALILRLNPDSFSGLIKIFNKPVKLSNKIENFISVIVR